MTKTTREIIITAILIVVLITITINNLSKLRKRRIPDQPPAPPAVLRVPDQIPVRVIPTEKPPTTPEEWKLKVQKERISQKWGREPFALSSELLLSSTVGFLTLGGISWDEGEEKGIALINDFVVEEGDEVEGYQVKEIERNRVTLEKEGRETFLILKKE